MSTTVVVGDMHSETDPVVAVKVDLPPSLLEELDAYAARRGYASPDSVVCEAIDRLE
jgi:metal-responsive CopG/Arc/MetJ family transcriptional regulator